MLSFHLMPSMRQIGHHSGFVYTEIRERITWRNHSTALRARHWFWHHASLGLHSQLSHFLAVFKTSLSLSFFMPSMGLLIPTHTILVRGKYNPVLKAPHLELSTQSSLEKKCHCYSLDYIFSGVGIPPVGSPQPGFRR